MAPKPRPFYPAELTERSRTVLHTVCEAAPGAILIGGWGTWVRIGGDMSHDIDLIVTHDQLAAVTGLGTDTSESRHLGGRKWRTLVDGIHVDLHVPYQSRLGQTLKLRVEHLTDHTEVLDRWTVLTLPAHVASKLAALTDRPHTAPGVKDRYELAALILEGVDPEATMAVLQGSSELDEATLSAAVREGLAHLSDGAISHEIRQELRGHLRAWDKVWHRLAPAEVDDADQRQGGPRRR